MRSDQTSTNQRTTGRQARAGGGIVWMGFIVVMLVGIHAGCPPMIYAADRSAPDAPEAVESYHAILLLDRGPVHARFGISLAGRSVAAHRAEFVQQLMAQLDTNDDGRLTRPEANESSLLRRSMRPGTLRFLRRRNLTAKQIVSANEVDLMFRRVAGQAVVFRQNNQLSGADEFLFDLLDANDSGVIDEEEMLTAAERLKSRDTDHDECVAFDEVQPLDEVSADAALAGQEALADEEASHAVFSELLRRADERTLPERLVRKYDLSGDRKLSPDELSWSVDRIRPIDANHDGLLSQVELLKISQTPLDLDLTVDIAAGDGPHQQLKIRHLQSAPRGRGRVSGRNDLMLQNTTLTVSYRHIDPVSLALDNARTKFNLLDQDTNGYLDHAEVEGEILLQQGLFATMDIDGDERLFGEEMDRFVEQRALAKSMSCQVYLYDRGRGFFHALDHNNDGRISAREMRTVDGSLRSLSRDRSAGVSKTEPIRRFHLEFVRGSYQLFGRGEQVAQQSFSMAANSRPGPVWFVASDRNNDGDLTWNEFLGHREDFHALDTDQDGLIDPQEAERATQLGAKRQSPATDRPNTAGTSL